MKLNQNAIGAVVLLGGIAAGCGSAERKARALPELLRLRQDADARLQVQTHDLIGRVLARAKAEQDEHLAGRRAEPPILDILIISGGGDWGAFGAGFLKGWRRVPPGPAARPEFDVVTGVSTGALIAPFAFLGTEADVERVIQLYRNPQKDWVKQRWPLYFLPSNISFAEVPGLEREMRDQVDMKTVERLAEAGKDGRMLIVNTTNVDDGNMRAWDVIAEARRAVQTGDVDRVHRILLASSGIPAAFPFREIDDELYVDGGVTGNILYGGRLREEETPAAVWTAKYPGAPIPKTRYWVIFNNQTRPLPQVTKPNWPAIISRSLEMGTRAATLTAMRHLHALAEISRLKHGAETDVRVASIPGDWAPPRPGVFIKETMNELADLGERMGADPASWRTDPP